MEAQRKFKTAILSLAKMGLLLFLITSNSFSQTTKVITSIPLKEQINDDAIMKLTILDKTYNFIGSGWSDREREGSGMKVILDFQKRIALKYGYTSLESCLSNYESSDLPEQIEGDGGNINGGYCTFYLNDAKKYYYLIRWTDKSKLPSVAYRNGAITLNYNKSIASFKERTECLLNGKEYIFVEGNWQQK
jgi:hypothetical protein